MSNLSAKERLESTRRAIAGELARKRGGSIQTEEEEFFAAPPSPDAGIFSSARRAARAWWHAHPVHKAVDLAQPLLEDYAQHRPLQLVGLAAGTGAALTLLKSWRVLSLTGVALALVKTSDIKSTARYFMGRQGVPETTAALPPEA
ncbi:hypothetical protein ASF43_10315 [Pseudorhodoferax sp. Leaf267]|nr:hypothetical protein ASF43_10315 [Pseudorhodoferax sp. Leaf267]